MTASPLGVCVFPAPGDNAARTVSYPDYLHEILAHAGVCYTPVPVAELPERLPALRLLLTVGEYALPENTREALRAWVEAGGAWLSVAGTCGLEALFGARVEPPTYSGWTSGQGTLGEGYLIARPPAPPLLQAQPIPLHFFNGLPMQADGGTVLADVLDAHQRPTSRAAILDNRAGQGRCLLLAPDIPGTVVSIQQGIAVTRDGVPAPDGTAPLADNVLKSGDGGVLDWIFDRQPVPGTPGLSAFLHPIADQWRGLLLRALFALAEAQEIALPLLWFYPRNLPALGHLSHDTDINDPGHAAALLAALKQADARSTWCVILPGYDKALLAAIRAAGGELATHYDALEHPWSEAEFDRQWRQLCALFAPEVPVSNKNHYLRWEGDTEFFDWCAQRGIRLDQSKGASKSGEAGFNFGTCHLFFPVGWDGRLRDVLELPTPTQDLNVFAPDTLLEPLLQAALRHYGILHLLFHPAHMVKEPVVQAFLTAVARGKESGLEWWTARELDAWERARRRAHWSDYGSENGGAQVTLQLGESLPGATVLWLSPNPRPVTVNGRAQSAQTVERWGFRFQSVVLDAEQPGEYRIALAGH
jgi:hypothetical protein